MKQPICGNIAQREMKGRGGGEGRGGGGGGGNAAVTPPPGLQGRLKKFLHIRNLLVTFFCVCGLFMCYNYWCFVQSHFRQEKIQETQHFLRSFSKDLQIPRIIHQSWKNTNKIPDRFSPWIQSWLQKNPNWLYVFWTDEENLQIFEKKFPHFFSIAKKVSKKTNGKIGLADMSRYALLYEIGGLYADTDFECLQSFEDLHVQNELFLSSEPLAHTVLLEHSPNELALCNALMASRPKHPFWLRVLEKIKEKFEREEKQGTRIDPVSLTGPRIVKETYLDGFQSDETIRIFPQEYFYPEIAYWNLKSMKRNCQGGKEEMDVATRQACEWLEKYPKGQHTQNTHAVHHWQCTWCQREKTKEYVTLQDIFQPFITKKEEGEEANKIKIVRPIIDEQGITFESYF